VKYDLPSPVPTVGRLRVKPLALYLAGFALAAMSGLALAYVFVDRAGEAPAAAVSGVPDVSLDRDAGFLFAEWTGSAPAPTSLAAVTAVAPVVFVVGSEGQLRTMRLGLAEADAVRYEEGLSPLGSELVLVSEGDSDAFFEGIAEANSVRATEGLPPFAVVDLR
jgi:hypothetical protein